MYMQVYYHKVNMLTQEYLIRLLKRVKQLSENGDLNVDKDLHGMLFNEYLSGAILQFERFKHNGKFIRLVKFKR